MLYVTMLENHKGKVFVEADTKEEATQLAQAEVTPVPEPETQTVVLVHRDGTQETIEFREPQSAELLAVRRALESAA